MKMMKLALLGGAALAVTAAGAQADDLNSLKAEVEALNARVAQLEAAPAVPAGYQLLTVGSADATVVPGNPQESKFGSAVDRVTRISVVPTADAPATASIEWSGYVRAILGYSHVKMSGTSVAATSSGSRSTGSRVSVTTRGDNLTARAQLQVVAKTDTSVGEVGVRVVTRGDFGALGADTGTNLRFHEGWGWWAMTPELTLGGGYTRSLGNVGYGYDAVCTCYGTDNASVDFTADGGNGATQMRLTYASGPLSMGLAIENSTGTSELAGGGAGDQNAGVAGQIAYSGDTVNAALDAFYHAAHASYFDESTGALKSADDPYGIGAGIGFALGDMAKLSIGGQYAHTGTGYDRWGLSALASMNLSDAVHAELGGGFRHYNNGGGNNWGVLAGLYYAPVKQLTIGLEGEWYRNGAATTWSASGGSATGTGIINGKTEGYVVDLVTVFAF